MIDHGEEHGDPRDECAAFEPLLAAYADGPLRERDYQSLMAHLERCERCFLTVASGALVEPTVLDGAIESVGDDTGDNREPASPGSESEFEATLVPTRRRSWRIAGLAAAVVLAAAITLLLVQPPTTRHAPVADRDAADRVRAAGERPERPDPEPEPTRAVEPPAPSVSIPAETDEHAHDALGSIRAADGVEVVLFATWRKAARPRSPEQLTGVTLRSNIAGDHRWTGHEARKIARTLARQGKPHTTATMTSDDGRHRLSLGLYHKNGRPWRVVVEIADRRLVADWPKIRSRPGSPDTTSSPDPP